MGDGHMTADAGTAQKIYIADVLLGGNLTTITSQSRQ